MYAGLKDRSIIVWSVLDGESFCFEGNIELRSGKEGLVTGSGCQRALLGFPLAGSLCLERCLQVKGSPPLSLLELHLLF